MKEKDYSRNKIIDQRSKKFIFVPFCLICQAFQAQGIVKYGFKAVIKPIVKEILRYDINIIQMPCPESQFGGYERGLQRKPKSIDQYDKPAFRKICKYLAKKVIKMIKGILANGYEIIAILGMEFSPSCSVNFQYSQKGIVPRSGLFIDSLKKQLKKEKIKIPFIGINKRNIKKSLVELRKILEK